MDRQKPMLAALVAATLSACGAGHDGAAPPAARDCAAAVPTPSGRLAGVAAGQDVCAYLGVPFAAPPVGQRRLRPPAPAPAWTGVRQAKAMGPDCPQGRQPVGSNQFAEDCLTLNVWRPATATAVLPVMVFFYGGGFTLGGTSWEWYEGSDLARNGVIVVTANYRLGPLGFLALPALAAERPDDGVGNDGLRDQAQALRWVQAHIGALGGDPNNVTVFGESAGAFSTCALVASPETKGLVHRAIMESGLCYAASPARLAPLAQTYVMGIGCPATGPESVACLRAWDASALIEATAYSMFDGFLPVVDGTFLPAQPIERLGATAPPVPMIVGFNHDELRVSVLDPRIGQIVRWGWGELWQTLAPRFDAGELATIRQLYGPRAEPDPAEAVSRMFNDLVFACGNRAAAAAQARLAPTWLYDFSLGDTTAFADVLGTFHGIEIPVVFGNPTILEALVLESRADRQLVALSDRVQRYWTRFARHGDPNGHGDPAWPVFGSDGDGLLLGPESRALPAHRAAACDFWSPRLPTELVARMDWLTDFAGLIADDAGIF